MSSGRRLVAIFTQGITLPLEPLHPIQLEVIADAIAEAWGNVVAVTPDIAAQDPELVLNTALVDQLLIALDRPSPFTSLVSTVVRGAEQKSFDGSHFEKKPDLNIYLTRRNARFPLVGECKIIDHASQRDLRKYERNGIDRFVRGEYAWAATEGFMVAYVRDATQAGTALATVSKTAPERWPGDVGPHYRSRHDRAFEYVARDPKVERPGPIELIHLWLEGAAEEAYVASAASDPAEGLA